MEKVDRLGWTDGIIFTAFGTRFGIRTNSPEVVEQIQKYLPPGWEPDSEPVVDLLYSLRVGPPSKHQGRRNYNLLYMSAGRIARSLDMAEIYENLESNLQLLTAYLAKGYLFVHAGAVGWQGQAIIMPGRSFVGKTTLVTALLKAGATYYSDDYTVFDTEGRVHPYPMPLSIRDEAGENAQKIPVEDLGGVKGREPLPVGLVVLTEYQAGARWQPRSLTPGRALLAMLDHIIAAREDPKFSLPILQQVATGARAIKTRRGEAGEVVKPLLSQLPATYTYP
jgi:hypothetical protein